jgi:hypothetical protein
MDTLEEAQMNFGDKVLDGQIQGVDTSNISPEMMEKFGEPTASLAERTQSAASEVLSAGSSILVDGGISLVRSLIPDSWEDSIVDFSRDKWEAIAKSPIMQQGIEYAKAGKKEYDEWAKANPEWATRLNEAVNIGALGRAPGKTLPGQTPNAPKLRGETYIRKQNKNNMNNRKAATQELLEPPTKKNNYGKYYEDKRGTVRWDPNSWTRDVIDEVVKVKDVSPKKSFVHNMNAVRGRSQSFRKELDDLVSTKGTKVNVGGLKEKLQSSVDSMADEVLLSSDAEKMAAKIYRKTEQLLDASDGTSMGVLNVRRQLDEWVNSQRNVFDATFESATSIALREIRGILNNTVSKSTKSAKVDTLLKRQHKLLTAGDMLEEKAMKQADTYFGRFLEKFERDHGIKFPTTPLAQAATVGAATATMGTTGLLASVGGFGAYKGARWLTSPDGKKWLAAAVKLTDQYPNLKPEVNALVQLSEGLKPEEEEEEQ